MGDWCARGTRRLRRRSGLGVGLGHGSGLGHGLGHGLGLGVVPDGAWAVPRVCVRGSRAAVGVGKPGPGSGRVQMRRWRWAGTHCVRRARAPAFARQPGAVLSSGLARESTPGRASPPRQPHVVPRVKKARGALLMAGACRFRGPPRCRARDALPAGERRAWSSTAARRHAHGRVIGGARRRGDRVHSPPQQRPLLGSLWLSGCSASVERNRLVIASARSAAARGGGPQLPPRERRAFCLPCGTT